MKKTIIIATTALIMGVSCSTKNSATNSIDINGDWKVSTIAGEKVPETLEEASLSFDEKQKSYHGVTGVNLINGSYQLKDHTLTIEEGAMTRKMGDSISNDIEMKYINAIHATRSVTSEGGKLILLDEEGNMLMELVK